MAREFTAFGHVNSEGILSVYEQKGFKDAIKNQFSSSSVEVVIRDRNYKFSDAQRAYYYAVVVTEIKQAYMVAGYLKSLKDIDSELKGMFLFYEDLDSETGEFEKVLHSLGNLNTQVSRSMMMDYCERCVIWCVTNLNWAIPFPSEIFGPNDMTNRQKQILSGNGVGISTF